jgi:NTP pyrophosphatase (non-canonical NTP hydrolase)
MTHNIDLNKYKQFVEAVTSKASNDLATLHDRLDELNHNFDPATGTQGPKVNIASLMTACFGLAAESGEFIEVPKKIIFQGKPLTDAEVFHLKRELGDVMWYWINACRALNLDPNEVIDENVRKLESRYPGGAFDAHYSENRKEGDI